MWQLVQTRLGEESAMTDQPPSSPIIVRRMTPEDFDTVVRVWHESKQVAYPYLPLEQGRTLAEDDRFFRDRVVPQCDVWGRSRMAPSSGSWRSTAATSTGST